MNANFDIILQLPDHGAEQLGDDQFAYGPVNTCINIGLEHAIQFVQEHPKENIVPGLEGVVFEASYPGISSAGFENEVLNMHATSIESPIQLSTATPLQPAQSHEEATSIEGVAHVFGSSATQNADTQVVHRPVTRSQRGIIKPKVITDGRISLMFKMHSCMVI
ncbi:hypothetical protein GUJ93_ZPchr0013g35828 [Zizania palustris]|uniref:Uncharacterized protein n=1 Tax=Zizania palustris TaxID=103762 RepID=A0A8J5X157_ZIZPA|nr:hypothetical protein GUJ93_ZPchr0013g35828 [Zizania palustris]